MNLNPTLFEDRFTELMEGEVSPNEFATRVNNVYDRVVSASDEIKRTFAERNGFDITLEGILASALDPEMGDKILLREIDMAEIGGAFRESGFYGPASLPMDGQIGAGILPGGASLPMDGTIGTGGYIDELMLERMVDYGVTLDQARQTGRTAESMVPVLDVLARRHADPDDDFDINEFINSEIFQNPQQNLRMRRLINQERSLFGGSFGVKSEGGALSGLTVN